MATSLKALLLALSAAVLAACSGSSSQDRYSLSQDKAPHQAPILEHVEDPVPRVEPMSKQGNRDYTVRGKSYQVWRDIEEHKTTGTASWYGKKFHGHLTSNGEIYDMYSMSAAHKNLPLPSYVRVTNLANDKSVIVRVNDRGPFHQERIIDLSYAAAYRLDMLKSGTAKVEIELIKPEQGNKPSERAFIEGKVFYLQLLASKNETLLAQHQQVLQGEGFNALTVLENGWQKLRVGPYYDRISAEQALEKLKTDSYNDAYIVKHNLD